MKKIIFSITLLLFTFGCKQSNEKDTKVKQSENQPLVENKIQTIDVVINAIVPIDDTFEVYFYEPGLETFHSEDFVATKVIGSSKVQEIKFSLPEHMYPERLRLDFGKNTAQQEMEVMSIKLLYGSKEYEFSNEEVTQKFKPSKYIDFDSESKKIKTLVVEGKYDPYFYTMKVTNIVNYLIEN